jgi:cation diffusion facilitator CzcD-associated flavoprotein CzcO
VVILEQRERLGGTWDLFRHPGIRSDSDIPHRDRAVFTSPGFRRIFDDGPRLARGDSSGPSYGA